ncbi:NUDIX domain-containing protein [Candidatus Woesearchaeota archaeon]|nr:NUDIX domain-containing protein [Candidatus Woesearchaeota archaeon]
MIKKVAIAVIRRRRLLLVRKKGLKELILPGGKPHKSEPKMKALRRELKEELGISIKSARFIGRFSDRAAGRKSMLVVFLYKGEVAGSIKPQMEIRSAVWVSKRTRQPLSPIIKNRVLPFLIGKGWL